MTQIRKEYQNNTTHNKVYSPYPAGYAPYTNRCVPFEKIDEMNNINFNNKKFILLENSKSGTVNSNTIFTYEQRQQTIKEESLSMEKSLHTRKKMNCLCFINVFQ